MARDFWELVKEQAQGGVMRTRVRIEQGDQLVRFFYPQRIPQQDDGSYELRLLAPLASFVIVTGGSISFSVGLPRIPGRTITVSRAAVENPPGTPIGERRASDRRWPNGNSSRITGRTVRSIGCGTRTRSQSFRQVARGTKPHACRRRSHDARPPPSCEQYGEICARALWAPVCCYWL